METFTFFRIRHGVEIPPFEIEVCANIDDAKGRAKAILKRERCEAVEIVYDDKSSLVIEPEQ